MPETTVECGQTVNGLVLSRGDYQHVAGTANDTVVNEGGGQLVYLGTANNSIVNFGGYQVTTQATVNGTVVNVGGDTSLYDGARSNGLVLNGGRQSLLAPTALASGTVINGGGVQSLLSGNADGTVIGAGGSQFVSASSVYPTATPAVTNTTILGGGLQQIDLSQGNVGVTGTRLLAGGAINVTGFGRDGTTVTTFNQASGTLTLQSGAQSYSMQLAGNYAGTALRFTSFGSSTRIEALCFCRGTGIRTPAGDVPVERLRVGDEVATLRGSVRRVRWIGSSTAIVRADGRPVVVRAGAFPDGTPHRDVRVTHLHSFLFGEVLIPIGDLVNGDSIVWDAEARVVEAFHLALDTHDVVLAEGAPAETYRDDGNRAGFHAESGTPGATRAMPTCAPVIRRGPIVERTRRRLAALAAARRATQSPTVRGSELVSSSIS